MPTFLLTKVEPAQLSSSARSIEESLNLISRSYERITNAMLSELDNAWEGESKNAFFERYNLDSIAFFAHFRAFQFYNERLREASAAYSSSDDAVKRIVHELKY